MIWRKAWLECRFRAGLAAIMLVFLIASIGSLFGDPAGKGPVTAWDLYCRLLAVVVAMMVVNFAGSGINTQSKWGVFPGFHPSMYFLLSMPISRRQSLLVRAAVGWLLTVATIVLGVLGFLPLGAARGLTPGPGSLVCTVVFLCIGSAAFFGLATLLTTLIEEVWAGVLGYMAGGAFFGLGVSLLDSPKLLNPLLFVDGEWFRRTGEAHWLAIATYLALGAALMMASIFVVERKEY